MSKTMTVKDLISQISEVVGDTVADKIKAAHEAAAAGGSGPGNTIQHPQPVGANRSWRADKLLTMSVEEMTVRDRSLMAARCVRYMILANNNPDRAIQMAKVHGEKTLVDSWEKALGADTLAGGGAMLPPEFSSAVIEELGAKSVVRRMGTTVLPMNSGSLTTPFISGDATAAYTVEGANATKSEPTFGQLQLSDKELVCLVPVGNRLLANGGPTIDNIIRQHMVRVMRRKEDVTFIRSSGASGEPKGMLYWCPASQKNDANGTVNLANVTTDLGVAIRELKDQDVDLDESPGWLMAPRTEIYLKTVRDTNGNLAFKPEMDTGMLYGYPFAVTSQIPDNLGGATNESEVYLAAFDMLVIAENETLAIEAFPGGAYHDGSAVQSGISRNETVIRTTALHDFGAQQRGTEIAIIEAVKWGV